MRQRIQVMIITASLAVLSACGFQWRGAVTLPAGMERVYVQGDHASLLLREIRYALNEAGASVVNSPEPTAATLQIHGESRERRVLSIGADARAREYEVIYKVDFSVRGADGKPLVPRQNLELARDYSFNENDVLAKEREEQILNREMQSDAAHVILRRINLEAHAVR